MSKKQFNTDTIEIPDKISSLHKLAFYLLREYIEEENYQYNTKGLFDVLSECSNAYGIKISRACKITAIDVEKRYKPRLNSKFRQQFTFIIEKRLEYVLNKTINN
jgi:hypothetical protein